MKMQMWQAIVLFTVLAAFALGLSGLVAMLLWNSVIVALFGVKPIGFWLGVGIALVLAFIGSAFRAQAKG